MEYIEIKALGFTLLAPYHKIRTETQQFADVNYFGSYVSVQEDGTVKADHEAMYQNPCIVYSPHDLALVICLCVRRK